MWQKSHFNCAIFLLYIIISSKTIHAKYPFVFVNTRGLVQIVLPSLFWKINSAYSEIRGLSQNVSECCQLMFHEAKSGANGITTYYWHNLCQMQLRRRRDKSHQLFLVNKGSLIGDIMSYSTNQNLWGTQVGPSTGGGANIFLF